MVRQLRFITLLLICLMLTSCGTKEPNYIRDDVSYEKPVEIESDFYYVDTTQKDLGYVVCYMPANWHFVMTRLDSELDKTVYSTKDESSAYKIPLSYGNGSYEIKVVNSSGVCVDKINVSIRDVSDDVLYTMSNDVVDFSSSELVKKIASDLYKKSSSNYDYLKLTTQYTYYAINYDIEQRDMSMFVSIDNILVKGIGVCYEKAKLLTAMLRIKNIPCKLVFGDFGEDKSYHAWCEVYVDGQWYIADPTQNSILDINNSSYSCTKVY